MTSRSSRLSRGGSASATYTATIRNVGETPVEQVTLRMGFVGTVESIAASHDGGVSCAVMDSQVQCGLDGLAPGASATLNVDVTVASSGGGYIIVYAFADFAGIETDYGDNYAELQTEIIGASPAYAHTQAGTFSFGPQMTRVMCDGEVTDLVALDPDWHVLESYTFSNHLLRYTTEYQPQGAVGTSLLDGTIYQVSGTSRSQLTAQLQAGFPLVFDLLGGINLTSRGGDLNVSLRIREHVTINAMGTITAERSVFSAECR